MNTILRNLSLCGTPDLSVAMKNVVTRLTTQLREYVNSGRSTKGVRTSNDTGNNWKQVKPVFENQ